MNCRFCKQQLAEVFIDLQHSPASNSFLKKEQLNEPEVYFPLKVFVCHSCFLVQIDEYKKSDAIFDGDYVYYSSYSSSWLQHSQKYVDTIVKRLNLTEKSLVVEVASNDGYLLQFFQTYRVPVLGIEPTANTASVAQEKGIETIVEFFGEDLASRLSRQGRKADLLLGNNVLAHVPDIVDFVKGLKILLADSGMLSMEFPHLLQLIKQCQFDTIYHEHFSYLSFSTVQQIFATHGLKMIDVEELSTHGGSLRIFACHEAFEGYEVHRSVTDMINQERAAGLQNLASFAGFQDAAFQRKAAFLTFLLQQKSLNKKVVAYGAAAKGNTLLNYAGVKSDLIMFVVDANPHKQNKFLPGSHIPVRNEFDLKQLKPDYVIIFPWNIKDEIMEQLAYIRDWGGRFVVAIPELLVY